MPLSPLPFLYERSIRQPGRRLQSTYLPPAQAEDIEEAGTLHDFGEDIAMMRRRIAALIRDPSTDPDLINRTMKVLCRMMDIQRRYRFG